MTMATASSLQVLAEREAPAARIPQGVRRLLRIALADKVKQARKQLPVAAQDRRCCTPRSSRRSRDATARRPVDRLRATWSKARSRRWPTGCGDDPRPRCLRAASRRRRQGAVRRGDGAPAAGRGHPGAGGRGPRRAGIGADGLGAAATWTTCARSSRAGASGLPARHAGDALAEYPRYLKAMKLRAERAKRDPTRDQARMLELRPFAQAMRAARSTDPEWQALRWDLEELRVRCSRRNWAQAGVSPKKLAARLARLRQLDAGRVTTPSHCRRMHARTPATANRRRRHRMARLPDGALSAACARPGAPRCGRPADARSAGGAGRHAGIAGLLPPDPDVWRRLLDAVVDVDYAPRPRRRRPAERLRCWTARMRLTRSGTASAPRRRAQQKACAGCCWRSSTTCAWCRSCWRGSWRACARPTACPRKSAAHWPS